MRLVRKCSVRRMLVLWYWDCFRKGSVLLSFLGKKPASALSDLAGWRRLERFRTSRLGEISLARCVCLRYPTNLLKIHWEHFTSLFEVRASRHSLFASRWGLMGGDIYIYGRDLLSRGFFWKESRKIVALLDFQGNSSWTLTGSYLLGSSCQSKNHDLKMYSARIISVGRSVLVRVFSRKCSQPLFLVPVWVSICRVQSSVKVKR